MSDEIKHVKNKNIKQEDDFYNTEYDEKSEEYYNDLEDEYREEEYFKDTSYYIYTSIMNFVNNKSLPLCEHLKTISLERFMNSNVF